MKKKGIVIALMAVILIGAVFFVYHENRQYPLSQICPEIENGGFHAALVWDGMSGSETAQGMIPEEELSEILKGAVLERGRSFEATPSPAFEITVTGAESYSIVVGFDGSVAVAERDDLEGSRTFWEDPTGKLFLKLYERHLLSGGVKAP